MGNIIHHIEASDALFVQKIDRLGILLAKNSNQHIRARYFFLTAALNMKHGPLQHSLES